MGEGVIRVGHVIHGLMMGGLEQVVVRLADATRRYGVESHVIAFGADGSFRDVLEQHGLPYTYLGPIPGMSSAAIQGIARAFRDRRIDIAHAHDVGPWLNAVAARGLAPWVRPVATFHQIATPQGLNRGAAMTAALLSNALIACGNEVKSCVEGWAPPGARVELIGNGVPLGAEPTAEMRAAARARLKLPADAVVLGYLGRLHEEKGVDLLVKAFLRDFQDRPNVHLALIGRGHLEEELRQLVAAAGCDRVHFLGEIVAASSLLPGFDIYVQPSRREGRSLSMLEAMAAALPTVAQALPAISEIHLDGETALLVEPGEQPDFSTAIKRLIDDPDLRLRMGQRARQHVQRYSVDVMAEEYARLYGDILSRSRRWLPSFIRRKAPEAAL